jgi:hypothetical protein
MAVAALPLPIVEPAPGSYTRFRRALARSVEDRRYRDVPVDWWDAFAGVWRPTAVVRAAPQTPRTHADVLVPEGAGASMFQVSIDDLRLSELLTAGIARYWTTRYRRLLLLTLVERCDLSDASLVTLHALHAQLVARETHARDVWATAFRVGAGPSSSTPLHPLDDGTLDAAARDGVGLSETHGPDEATLTDAAIPLLAFDLVRLHGALGEAGVHIDVACAHPVVTAVAGLFRAAVESAGYARVLSPRDWVTALS